MNYNAKSIRSFIGARNFDISRQFYTDLGFEEVIITPDMSLFKVNDQLAFYLQHYYIKDWINNSMIFLEVDEVEANEQTLLSQNLLHLYTGEGEQLGAEDQMTLASMTFGK